MCVIPYLKRLISKAQIFQFAQGRGPVVYFAHSKLDYGTPAAKRARALIQRIRPGARILDPSRFGKIWPDLVERLGSHDAVYDLVIDCVSEVFALEHQDFVGRGVFNEVAVALRKARPAYAIREGRAVQITGYVVSDPNDYKRRFGRLLTASIKEQGHVEQNQGKAVNGRY